MTAHYEAMARSRRTDRRGAPELTGPNETPGGGALGSKAALAFAFQ
jgi:hypothetical protein